MTWRSELVSKTLCAIIGTVLSSFLAAAITWGLFTFFSPLGIDNGFLLAAIIFGTVLIPAFVLCVAVGLYIGNFIDKRNGQKSDPRLVHRKVRG